MRAISFHLPHLLLVSGKLRHLSGGVVVRQGWTAHICVRLVNIVAIGCREGRICQELEPELQQTKLA